MHYALRASRVACFASTVVLRGNFHFVEVSTSDRTLGTVARTHDFQSCTFDRSVISPGIWCTLGLPPPVRPRLGRDLTTSSNAILGRLRRPACGGKEVVAPG